MRLARIFTDNAVFRANAPLRLFGQGKGEISITLCGNTYKQTVTEENWIAEFPAQPYGGLYNMKIKLCGDGRGAKNETIVLKNVAFGEVLLCAGQSNMQFELREEINADKGGYQRRQAHRANADDRRNVFRPAPTGERQQDEANQWQNNG